jgi:hypothetical protein
MELILWWDIFTENGTCIIIISYLEDLEYILYTLYICAAVYNCDVVSWIDVCVCVCCLFLGFRPTHWSAPEVQTQSTVSAASDMFSLGLVVAAIFNRGRPLIQANHSNPNYTKQMEMVILHWPRIKTLSFTTNISFNITGIILLDSRSIASSPL